MIDRRLEWVHKNRVQGRRPLPVGPIAQDLTKALQSRLAGKWRDLTDILAEHIGPELLDHAAVVGAAGGVLTLRVKEPARLYHLRLQWEQRLLQILQEQLPALGINVVRFTIG